MDDPVFTTVDLSITAGSKTILNPVTLDIAGGGVFGIIGPSGAGKSTFLKSLNRLTELSHGLTVSGQVYFDGEAVYAANVDPDVLRSRIGILFQQPVVFPSSILANTLFGVRHLGVVPKRDRAETAERALRQAALWDEVKDRLKKPAQQLSVGQQQRLCLARTLATGPQAILMDEPTSALDPKSTEAIEALILDLKTSHSIVLVTHNLRQTERVCDKIAFIGIRNDAGSMLATGKLADLKCCSGIPELEEYLCCELEGTQSALTGKRIIPPRANR